MRILLINPPHPSIGSRIPLEHLPPLGLLSVEGPLIDIGHEVQLLDAEFGPLTTRQIVEHAASFEPEAILISHSGSTSGHPIVAETTRALRRAFSKTWIIYGGVFPTYHWREILTDEPQINFIVRGEGEETAVRLVHALETRSPFQAIPGIAYWYNGWPLATPPAPMIYDLDAYRVGWELIDHRRYKYWGNRRVCRGAILHAAARMSAIIAGSAASGLVGGIRIRASSPRSLPGCIEAMALR